MKKTCSFLDISVLQLLNIVLQEVSRLLLGLNCGSALETVLLPDSAVALSSKYDFDLQVSNNLPVGGES